MGMTKHQTRVNKHQLAKSRINRALSHGGMDTVKDWARIDRQVQQERDARNSNDLAKTEARQRREAAAC